LFDTPIETQVLQHTWVKHTITPVAVLQGLEGEPIVLVDPEEQEISEVQTTVYGCGVCYEPLATHFNTPCSGLTEEDLRLI
jgi:hypothetical protein